MIYWQDMVLMHICHTQVGDVAVGTVQSVQLYGAFLEFEDGTSGLLHVSQISHDRVANVGDVLSVGDKIKVQSCSCFSS